MQNPHFPTTEARFTRPQADHFDVLLANTVQVHPHLTEVTLDHFSASYSIKFAVADLIAFVVFRSVFGRFWSSLSILPPTRKWRHPVVEAPYIVLPHRRTPLRGSAVFRSPSFAGPPTALSIATQAKRRRWETAVVPFVLRTHVIRISHCAISHLIRDK